MRAVRIHQYGGVDTLKLDTIDKPTINDDDDREIMVEPYDDEITIMCGEEIPEIPTLVFTGGCGDYVVDFTEEAQFPADSDDYMIVRTWNVTDQCGNTATFEQVILILHFHLR